MAFNQGVYDWVLANIDNPEAIAAAMAQYGVTSEQLAAAIGLDTSAVSNYLQSNNVQVPEPTPVDTGPVDTGPIDTGPIDTGFVDTGPVVSGPVTPSNASGLDINAEVKDIKDYFKLMTGAAPTMSDAEIASYITNNPETYNLDLLWLTEKINPTLQPVVTPPTGPVVDTGSVDTGSVDTGGGGGFEDVITDPVSGGATAVTPSTPTTVTATTITDADNNTYDRATILKLAQQISQNFDASSSGGAFGVTIEPDTTIGFRATDVEQILGQKPSSAQMVIFDMARGLAAQGITDVSELAKYKPTEVTVQDTNQEGGGTVDRTEIKYIDPATGKEFFPNFGATFAGEGGTSYGINIDPSGTTKFVTRAEDTSDAGTILPVISVALMAIPAIGQAVGSAILGSTASVATATAVGNAVINASIQIAAGVDPAKAIGSAAASIFGSQATPALSSLINESLGNVQVSNIIAKAVEGGVKAVLTDQDVGKSALASATGQTLGSITQQMIDDPATARQIASAVSMGTSAVVGGQDVATSVLSGLIQGSNAAQKQGGGAASGASTSVSEPSSAGPNLTDDLPDNILKPITLTPEEIASQGRSIAASPDATVSGITQDPVLQQVINDAIDASNRTLIADTFAKYQTMPATAEQIEAWVQWAKTNPDENLVQAIETGYQTAGVKPISEIAVSGPTSGSQAQDTTVNAGAPSGRVEVSAPSEPVLTDTSGTVPTDAEVLGQIIADRGGGTPINAGAVTVTAPKEPVVTGDETLPTDTSMGGGLPVTPATGGPVVVQGKPDVIDAGSVTVTGKKDLLETDPVVVQSTKLIDQGEPVVVTGKPKEDLLPTDTEILDIVKEDLKPEVLPEVLPEDLLPTTLAPTKVRPGTRVVEDTGQILPLRPGLSEGYLGDIEGTPEQKQEPVWNVRSLKLRRLLGI